MSLQRPVDADFRRAERALKKCDPRLKTLIERVGPCTLKSEGEVFPILVRTIVAQQLSTKAATTISGRLSDLCPRGLTAMSIGKLTDEQIRGCGLSASKTRSVRDLCARVASGELPVKKFDTMSDEDIRESMLQVYGIGPWSVDMYLIFCLGRLDVLPVGDLGLRLGVREVYELAESPKPSELIERAEPWRPYRSIATWYFWRSRGGVPQS